MQNWSIVIKKSTLAAACISAFTDNYSGHENLLCLNSKRTMRNSREEKVETFVMRKFQKLV